MENPFDAGSWKDAIWQVLQPHGDKGLAVDAIFDAIKTRGLRSVEGVKDPKRSVSRAASIHSTACFHLPPAFP